MRALAAVLLACLIILAGCSSSDDALTTESTEATGSGLYPVSVDGKWGYIDKTGAIKIEPQFSTAGDFSDGLASVSVVEGNVQKWGYIDTSGTMVIKPQFDLAWPFSEGLAAVGAGPAEAPRFGFIDKTGRVIIPMQYKFVSAFSEGLCAVMVEEANLQLWGFIDKTGGVVIKPQFEMPTDFSEGLAGIGGGSGDEPRGFIDKDGSWAVQLPPNLVLVVEFPYLGKSRASFSEGLAIVQEVVFGDPGGPPSAENPVRVLQGFIDKTGGVVIKPQFDRATPFREGLAAVGIEEDGVLKWGFIDKMGAWVIQPQFDGAGFFSEGLALVALRASGNPSDGTSISDFRSGYIDKTGTVVIALQYHVSRAFSGGVARVEKWADPPGAGPVWTAYIDTTGKVIWQGK